MSREEYPRPQFERENWLSLNGEWQFAFDDQNLGLKRKVVHKRSKLSVQDQCSLCLSKCIERH